MKNKKLLYLYGMCLSLNAVAMQNEGNQANASGLTSSGNVAPQPQSVSLDQFMMMMEKQDARIEKLLEKQDTERAKQNTTIRELLAVQARQNARIEKLHVDGSADREKQDTERAKQNTTIRELLAVGVTERAKQDAERAEQNTTIRGFRQNLQEADRRVISQSATIERLDAERAKLFNLVEQHGATIVELRTELVRQNATIGELRDTIEKQNATIGELSAGWHAEVEKHNDTRKLVEQHGVTIERMEAERTQVFNHWQFTRVEPATQEATKRLGAEEQAARRTTRRAGNDEATK